MASLREEGIERLNNCNVATDHPFYLHFRSLFSDLERAAVHASGKMLDIGCGNKPYERMFAGRVQEHVGCDIVQSSDCRVDVVCPATDLAFQDRYFDTVLCTQVIEHVADHSALLRGTYRVLRNGGVLILSGPMYWPLHEQPYDFFRFTEHGLRNLLENIGFVVIEIVSNGGKWAHCGQTLIHTIQNTKFERRILISSINRLFGYLDERDPVFSNPMNYVVVARKPSAA